jgi:hypothetical protein
MDDPFRFQMDALIVRENSMRGKRVKRKPY